MIEEEVFGELTKNEYNSFIKRFTEEFGNPVINKRLKISFWDPTKDKNFDPQIRVTNGKAELMFKRGEWENKETRITKEHQTQIVSTTENFFNCFEMINSVFGNDFGPRIQQFESLIWEINDFEIKIARQFDHTNSKYLFEVEKLRDVDITVFTKKYQLDKLVLKTDLKFWEDWNDAVNNLNTNDITESEIRLIMSNYFKK